MKLSHVKIERRRADTARRIRRFVELAQLCPPGMVDWQKLADRTAITRYGERAVRRAGLSWAVEIVKAMPEPADAAVCSIVPESDPNPA